jgi:hypothetical protein
MEEIALDARDGRKVGKSFESEGIGRTSERATIN